MGFTGCYCEGEPFAGSGEYERLTYHAISEGVPDRSMKYLGKLTANRPQGSLCVSTWSGSYRG